MRARLEAFLALREMDLLDDVDDAVAIAGRVDAALLVVDHASVTLPFGSIVNFMSRSPSTPG